jgi:ApbE superfamily uncharacterized protein (UPF0280 family)
MREPPQIRFLPDGRRLHMHDGPIDLIVGADGRPDEVRAAYAAAARRFVGLLEELCAELPLLRAPVCTTGHLFAEPKNLPHAEVLREAEPRSTHHGRTGAFWSLLRGRPDCVGPAPQDEDGGKATGPVPTGPVARRMYEAVLPFADVFITPMAAVAGAVAEAVLAAMTDAARLARAYVNNGGDIALHLAPGEAFRIGMIDRPDCPGLFGTAAICAADPVRGVATSGWRGRSFSLGIADAVTILAATAPEADAAATIIANAVDLPGHPAVVRQPASSLQPDSDLGDLLVTRHVGRLAASEIAAALEQGEACAQRLLAAGLIATAALNLQGSTRVVGRWRGQMTDAMPRLAPSTMLCMVPLPRSAGEDRPAPG